MKRIKIVKFLLATLLFVAGIYISSYSRNTVTPAEEENQRLDLYLRSDIAYVSEMFFDESLLDFGVQPALTQRELDILDALIDRIDPAIRREFDQKYLTWLICWASPDLMPEQFTDMRQLLNCNGQEFQDLLEFCREQDDDIFLLLYQLAARATCPYDQMLLLPAYDLLDNFPEFNRYWREVDLSLQNEKPNLQNRTCNESTIWQTRKILETKYGYTYTNGLKVFFDTRKMLEKSF